MVKIKIPFQENKEKYKDKTFIPHEGSKVSARLEESKTPTSAAADEKTKPQIDNEELNSIVKLLSERKENEKKDKVSQDRIAQ